MCTHRRSPAPSHAAGLHTGRTARRARWLNRAGSSTRLCCLGRLSSGMRCGCWAGLRCRSAHARAHAPGSTRTPRARNCGPRARLLLLLLLLLLSLACSCCCCCCCSTHPPWRTPTSRGHIRVTRGLEPLRALVRAPPCTHNFGTRALATAWSGAGEPRLSERIWSRRCSGDRQTWAASKRFKDDASCETEESEAAGADSTKGRRRHKGACGGGERDWDGGFCDSPDSPDPWGTSRWSAAAPATKLVEGAPHNHPAAAR